MALQSRKDDGYKLSKDVGISTFFCDFYRNKLAENASWNTRTSRDKLRASNVHSYMKLQLTEEQRDFLGKAQPDKARFGNDWTLWNQAIRKIGLDVTDATMSALLEAERKWLPQADKEKSSKGAKLTQIIPAIERRISALKTATIAQGKQSITAFTTSATSHESESRGPEEADATEILPPSLADAQDPCTSAEVVSLTEGTSSPLKKRKSPATRPLSSSTSADAASVTGRMPLLGKKKSTIIRQYGVQSFFEKVTG